jgi:ParB-like chromosome segregation protein Spo0J
MTKELTIDPELRDFLPALTADELQGLRDSIVEEGRALVPIFTWANHDDTVIDGNNRYAICKELGLPFETKALKFETKSAVMAWMRKHALGRRNLTETQKRELLGKEYNKAKQETPGQPKKNGVTGDAILSEGRTRERFAETEGVSPKSVERAGKLAKDLESIPQEAKDKIATEQVKSSDKAVHDLAKLPPKKLEKASELIASGEVKSVKEAVDKVAPKPKPADVSPELKDLNKLLDLLGKAVRLADDINRDLYPSKHHKNVIDALDIACKSATAWKQGAAKR